MSISSEISRIKSNVTSAYSALSAKGATMPSVLNTANLKSTIESIEMMTAEAMSIETIRRICYVPSDFERNYTAVSYIESSGTQYIDTGFVPNQDTRIVCEAIVPIGSTNWLYGARTSSTSNTFTFAGSGSGYYVTGYNTKTNSFDASLNSDGVIHIDANKSATTVTTGNGTATITGTSGTFTAPCNLTLFGGNTKGTVTCGSVTIYSCKIYDNGTLVRDYVPCYRKSDGTAGLYDMVGKKFYANAGTGEFSAGVTVASLPEGYAQVEYIEGSGTQYIDT